MSERSESRASGAGMTRLSLPPVQWRIQTIIGFVIGVGLVLANAGPVPASDDQEAARRLSGSGQILALEAVLEHAQRHRPGRVLDVEFENEHGLYIYEIEILDARGVVWELELDAQTGDLLESKKEH